MVASLFQLIKRRRIDIVRKLVLDRKMLALVFQAVVVSWCS